MKEIPNSKIQIPNKEQKAIPNGPNELALILNFGH